MIDLHTHTIFSDGALIPAELARRAEVAGYSALAFTDHADASTLPMILDNVRRLVDQCTPYVGLDLFVGIELTHIPPPLFPEMVSWARRLGAQIVVAHGETLVEPVAPGTNLAAIEAGVDVLAHPGLITPVEVELAAAQGVALEITTRKGHSLSNGHVASLARSCDAKLVVNNDAHGPADLISSDLRRRIALGCGLNAEEVQKAEDNSRAIVQRLIEQYCLKRT
ncbi:MAG: histidinol phosphate phosphatase domain-containing protein [Desulfohalobiaceae bacterium]